jgi:hypothetical protein
VCIPLRFRACSARYPVTMGAAVPSVLARTASSAGRCWRNVIANAAQYFLPRVSALSGLQARLLRHVARNPRAQPFSEETLGAVKSESDPTRRALRKLVELELLREEQQDGRKRVWSTTHALPSTCEHEVYRWNGSDVYRKSTVLPAALM